MLRHAQHFFCFSSQEVHEDEARAYAESIGALFIETSAKANENVFDMFLAIARKLPPPVETPFSDIQELRNDTPKDAKKRDSCC